MGQIRRVGDLEAALVSRHKEVFPLAQRPIAPEPAPVDALAILRRARAQELSKVSFFRLTERKAAKKRAEEIAKRETEEEQANRASSKMRFQEELDDVWNSLNANDPSTVIAALEAAFEDNQDPAAPIDCEGNRASVVILYPPQDFLPDKKPALTPTGRPTLKVRNKTETSDLYARAVASTVLATVKEAFAVAPRLEQIATIVARKDSRAEDPEDFMAAIYAGTFSRDRLRRIDWQQVDALDELYIAPDAMLKRKGSTATLAPLDLSKEPQLQSVVEQLKAAL